MTDEWFRESGVPLEGSAGSATLIREEFVRIERSLEKMPDLAGNGGKILFVDDGAQRLVAKGEDDARDLLGLPSGSNGKSKSSGQGVTSSTTLEDDDDLSISLEAGSVYVVRAHLIGSYTTSGGIKYKANWSGGSLVTSYARSKRPSPYTPDNAAATFGDIDTVYEPSTPSDVDGFIHIIEAVVVTGATGGTLTIQFAQATSSVDTTTLDVGSAITFERVGDA